MVGRLGCFPTCQNALRRVQFILKPPSSFWTTHQCVLNSSPRAKVVGGTPAPGLRFTKGPLVSPAHPVKERVECGGKERETRPIDRSIGGFEFPWAWGPPID